MLPAALDVATFAAIAPRRDRKLRVHSLMMDETVAFDLDEAEPEAAQALERLCARRRLGAGDASAAIG